MEYVIEFNNVWKSFRRGERATLLRDAIPVALGRLTGRKAPRQDKTFWAIKDVSFKVKRGEILGIIGPNGAGKTTTLKLIAGIMMPNKGSITTKGRVSCLIIAGAGFHPQFTGRENIYLNGSIMGMSKKEIDRKFDSIVEFAGYGFADYKKFIDTPVKRYSSGMFVRLGFAIATHVEPDILLVDEILAVGDAVFQQKCFEYMNNLKKSNATIIMVSHSMGTIVNYCDRTILLKEGKIVAEGEPHKVVSIFEREISKKMSWFYAGKVPISKPRGAAILSNVRFDNARRVKDELHLDYGEPIVVSFDYDCLDYPLDDIAFSLIAYRKKDGCRCFCVSSHLFDRYLKKKRGHIELIVKDHNLLPNDYAFDLAIDSLSGYAPLAVYREREILIKPTEKYLTPQFGDVYQPENVSWNLK